MFEVTGAYRPCTGRRLQKMSFRQRRCGKAEQGFGVVLSLFMEEGRSQFFVFGNEEIRFTGIFCHSPATSPARENSLTGPQPGFHFHCLRGEAQAYVSHKPVFGFGGPFPEDKSISQIPSSFCPIYFVQFRVGQTVRLYRSEAIDYNRPHSRDPPSPY